MSLCCSDIPSLSRALLLEWEMDIHMGTWIGNRRRQEGNTPLERFAVECLKTNWGLRLVPLQWA